MLNLKSYQEIYKSLDNYYGNKEKNTWSNNFHIEMPFGLINDPNGLSYYDNKFHIFYQWNPFGCDHKTKHWGVVTTNDFLNFSKPKLILKPDEWFDKDGCYSGSGLVGNNELRLYYTGNVRGENGERESYQCLAIYNEEGKVEKKGVVIEKQPEGYTAHFRDPYIFSENNVYYMILGVQNEELKGRVLIYSSKDSLKWELLGELKTTMEDFGYMWECPNMVKLKDDKYAFIFSPQGLKKDEYKNKNLYQSGYVIGNLKLDKCEFEDHSEFKELDRGFDFYAPQVFNHDGKNIMIGWIGMPDKGEDYPTERYGWKHSLTIPRVLTYKDEVLYQEPIEDMKNLRKEKIVSISNLSCKEQVMNFHKCGIEIKLNLELKKSSNVYIRFKFNDEYILLTYNKENEVCKIDRSNMNFGGKGIRRFKLKTSEELKLNVFIDNSIMEIFFQDGEEVTTFVYFPKEEKLELQISDGIETKINELNVWSLRGIEYEK